MTIDATVDGGRAKSTVMARRLALGACALVAVMSLAVVPGFGVPAMAQDDGSTPGPASPDATPGDTVPQDIVPNNAPNKAPNDAPVNVAPQDGAPADIAPGTAKTLFDAGLDALRDRDFAAAIENFDAALVAGGDNARIRFFRGVAHSFNDQFDPAVADFDVALALGFEPAGEVHAELARVYLNTGEFDRAHAALDEAVRLGSDSEGFVRFARGFLLLSDDEYEAAILDFNIALQFDPINPASIHRARGRAYEALGEHVAATKDFTQAIRLGVDDLGDVYALRGGSFDALDDIAAAIDDYTAALANDTSVPISVRSARARLFELQGDYDAAIDDYTAILTIGPNSPGDFLVRRAEAALALGREEMALADYGRAAEVSVDDADVQRRLGYAFHDLRQMEQSIAAFSKAFDLAPEITFGLDWRGYSHYYLGDFEAALADFDAVLADEDADEVVLGFALLWSHLSRFRLGRADGAELAAQAERLDLQAWPAPLVGLFAGTASPEDILAIAEDADRDELMSRLTVAHFYIGQFHLMNDRPDDAAASFRAVLDQGGEDYSEFTDAAIELERLAAAN